MTPTEIGALLTTVGFGPLAAYFMWVFVKSRIEAAEKAAETREALAMKTAESREAAAIQREQKLVDRLNHMEDNIRTQLVTLVSEAKDVMADCSGTLKTCAATLQSLNRSDGGK